MALTHIAYAGEDLNTFQRYEQLPEDQKHGGVWDSKDADICTIKKTIKDYYIRAQDYTCPYCQQRIEVHHNAAWDAEHIIPKSTHPKFIFEPLNLCISCKDCNNEKRDKPVLVNNARKTLPVHSEDYTIVHPHFDEFYEHIKIIETAGYYLPCSDKGRKTVETCGLLRFTYKYTNYGNNSQENKETILQLANSLMKASSPAEENTYLCIIEDTVQAGKKISKEAFLKQVEANK